jgi:hypothetical protein
MRLRGVRWPKRTTTSPAVALSRNIGKDKRSLKRGCPEALRLSSSSVGTVQRGFGASGQDAKHRINMETLLHAFGYFLTGFRAASLILATAAPIYLTFSTTRKSTLFVRACNSGIAVAMVTLTVYLYLTRR